MWHLVKYKKFHPEFTTIEKFTQFPKYAEVSALCSAENMHPKSIPSLYMGSSVARQSYAYRILRIPNAEDSLPESMHRMSQIVHSELVFYNGIKGMREYSVAEAERNCRST